LYEEDGEEEDEQNTDRMHLEDFQSPNVNEQQVMVFESAANEYFMTRNFQGLSMDIPAEVGTNIQMGQEGIAASYKIVNDSGSNNNSNSNSNSEGSSAVSNEKKVVDIEDILLQ
jgi:hypothetical protein